MCARVFGAAGSQNFGRTYLMLQPKYQRVDRIPTDEELLIARDTKELIEK